MDALNFWVLTLFAIAILLICVYVSRARRRTETEKRDAADRERKRLIAEIEADNAKACARAETKRFPSGSYK